MRGRGGQHDHRDVSQLGVSLHGLQQLTSVVFQEIQVEQDQIRAGRVAVGAAAVQKIQSFLTVPRHMQDAGDRALLECFPGDQLIARVILDQQDIKRAGDHHHRNLLASARE